MVSLFTVVVVLFDTLSLQELFNEGIKTSKSAKFTIHRSPKKIKMK